MAVKKKGLGRGIDGLFTSYIDNSNSKSSAAGKEKKAGKAAEDKNNEKKAVNKTTANASAEKKTAEKKTAEKKSAEKKSAEKKPAAKTTPAKGTTVKPAQEKTVPTKTAPVKAAPAKPAAAKAAPAKTNPEKAAAAKAAPAKAAPEKDSAEKTTSAKKAAVKKVEEKPSVITETAVPENKQVTPKTAIADDRSVIMVKLSQVEPNREQPRKDFREEGLEELAESIRQFGVIQPLLVQKREDYFEIIAGERRWRAARLAGLKEIPVIIKDYSEQEIVEVSLIENIQREDLNPIEEARAYQRLLQEFKLKQEDVAQRVSKNRTTITNSLRLLKLNVEVQNMLAEGVITSGHARALLGIEDPGAQLEIAKKVADEKLSVRDVERLMRAAASEKSGPKKTKATDPAFELICREMEEKLKATLGTKVTVNAKSRKSGRIEIEYYSQDELERLYDFLRSAGR